MVTGNVSTTNIGFTVSRNKANTIATSIAEKYPEMATPGSIYASAITATAVSKSFRIHFIRSVLIDLKV